jgi:anti-sigma factor RsiW
MKMPPRDWQTLNAYVDGELPPQEAAAVARAAGLDPAIADRISQLYHLKGCIHDAVPQAPADLASLIPPPAQKRPAMRWLPFAAGAMALAFLLVFALPGEDPQERGQEAFVASARILHQRWLERDEAPTENTTPAALAAITRFGRVPIVPDLESTGLTIGLVAVFDEPAHQVLQIGYRGHNGCHLSMFVVADAQLSNATIQGRGDLERSYAWYVGDLGYLLIAQGMDQGRFDLIADKVENATRTNAPLDSLDREELAANKLASARCAA